MIKNHYGVLFGTKKTDILLIHEENSQSVKVSDYIFCSFYQYLKSL